MKKRLKSAAGALLSLTMCSQAFALGTGSISSELLSTRSLGEGATGVAGVQNDPTVGYTNPAAMTAMAGTQAAIDLTYVNGSPTFTNGTTSPGGLGSLYTQGHQGDVSGARATSVFVPDFAVTTQFLNGRLAAGLAVVSPYGMETHFDGDSPIRYAATDARLRIIDITPSVAYKVCDGFSIGVGADYYDTLEGQLDKKVDVKVLNYGAALQGGAPPRIAAGFATGPDANSQLAATGDGWGYHLGTTIRPNEHHQLGVVYHSSVKMGLSGNVQLTGLSGLVAGPQGFGGSNFTASASAPIYMPQNVQIGYAYMPDDRWQFEADAAWYDFGAFKQLGIVYSGLTANQSGVLNNPAANPQMFNPRKTLNFALGANYKANDALQLRGGAYYEAASLPESTFDPAFVDLPRYGLAIGASYAITKSLSLDGAYNAVFMHGRSINMPDPIGGGQGYTGNFNSFVNLVSASLTYRTDAHF